MDQRHIKMTMPIILNVAKVWKTIVGRTEVLELNKQTLQIFNVFLKFLYFKASHYLSFLKLGIPRFILESSFKC